MPILFRERKQRTNRLPALLGAILFLGLAPAVRGQQPPGEAATPRPELWRWGLRFGAASPRRILASENVSTGGYVQINVTRLLGDRLRFPVQLGGAQFTDDPERGEPVNPLWFHASADLQWAVVKLPRAELYLQAGPGLYRARYRPIESGYNAGLGARFELADRIAVELGGDLHHVDDSDHSRFATLTIGVSFHGR
jgi:hypothetical protein